MRQTRVPEWLDRLLESYHTGTNHIFVLHGNVRDHHHFGSEYTSLPAGLAKLANRRPFLVRYDVAVGVRFPDATRERAFRETVGFEKDALPTAPGPALLLLDALLRQPRASASDTAIIIDFAQHLVPASPGPAERPNVALLARWSSDPLVSERRPLIVMIAPSASDLAAEVCSASGTELLRVARPDQAEREIYAATLRAAHPEPRWELSLGDFARCTGGLSLTQCEDIVTRASARRSPLSIDPIRQQKLELLRQDYGDVLEVLPSRDDLSAVGGHAHARRELAQVARLMRSGRAGAVPMGIALMGPPGTGKSHLAACFAGECGIPCVRFRPLRQMYVGQSERNQERAFDAIRALAPVVVIVDESDQAEGARRGAGSGDSGVAERMRGAAFQFWGDRTLRGRVLRLDITNRIDLIDSAMRRSGRTDVKIPILMPDTDERREILDVLARRLDVAVAISDFSHFAQRAEGFSGADLELALTTAYRIAIQSGASEVGPSHLDAAFDDIIPEARDQRELDLMTLLALEECRNRRLLPKHVDAIREQIARRGLLR